MGQPPYQDKNKLYELYHGKRLSQGEIAERFDVTDVTVSNWMDKLGVPTSEAWQRPGFVSYLYKEKKMTQKEIGELLGVHQSNISTTLKEANVETRKRGDLQYPTVYFSDDGYLTCRHRLGGRDKGRVAFRVHRLVAVAEYGYDAIAGKDVHHKNGHKVDNRPENLEPIDPSSHAKLHHEKGDIIS